MSSSSTTRNRRSRELFSSANNHQQGDDESAKTRTTTTTKVHRILCYGDSLTAGTSSSLWELYPYAPHLEKALNQDILTTTGSNNNKNAPPTCYYAVRHKGMPGWMASTMVESLDDPQYGLRAAIQGITNPSLSLVILLAGTNDLGYAMDEERVLRPIRALHEMAWREGVPHTLAIALPPSGYQSQVLEAASLATTINQKLQEFCHASHGRGIFVPFPFEYERNGNHWAPDGLHFSPEGYQVLGNYLKDPVRIVLQELDKTTCQGSN
jgi:lysophospholipase L1-like esterase